VPGGADTADYGPARSPADQPPSPAPANCHAVPCRKVPAGRLPARSAAGDSGAFLMARGYLACSISKVHAFFCCVVPSLPVSLLGRLSRPWRSQFFGGHFMSRIVGGILVLALGVPALAAEEKAKAKPASPAEQYQALLREYQNAQQVFFKEYQAAKTMEEKQKLFQEKYPEPAKYAPKFLELAEKHPKDRAAFDSLAWVANNINLSAATKDQTRAKAIAILLRDHLQNPQLGQVCQNLAYSYDQQSETFLRTALAKSPHADVQAEACLSLARGLGERAATARLLKKNPDLRQRYEGAFGKENVAALVKGEPAKIEAESEQLSRQFADKYLGQMKPERLKAVCQRLSYASDKGSEGILRAILEKSADRDVQGPA